MNQNTHRPSPEESVRTGSHRGILAALLIFLLAFGAVVPSAGATSSDERLLGVAKTTVYGALLGGLLGLASTLVVDEDDRGAAVRWGVALGTFGGFAYAVATYNQDDDLDDFSLRLARSRLQEAEEKICCVEGLRRPSALGCTQNVQAFDRNRLLSGIEVRNGGLEEKDSGEETLPGE